MYVKRIAVMEIILMLLFGFVAGIKHSIETDHIAAVSTIVARSKKVSSAVFAGSWWGIGHTIALFVLGCAVLLFGIVIPDRIGTSLELLVGIMLVVLGAINIKTGILEHTHLHRHKHNGNPEHIHLHIHTEGSSPHDHKHEHRSFGRIRAISIGTIHGLAGSAALTLLILSTIKSVPLGLLYIVLFGAGTIVGMSVFSLIISLPLLLASHKFKRFQYYSVILSGGLSIIIGLLLINTTASQLFI